jgi:hypothetical protein
MTTKDLGSFVGTPFTVTSNGFQTNFQINKYSSAGPDLKQSMLVAHERSTLNSILERLFKLEPGYFGKECNAVLLTAENVRQAIESKDGLFYALRNAMNPGDCAYVLNKAGNDSSAILLTRVLSPDTPLVLVTCKPEFAANSVIMGITEPGNEATAPQIKAGELLRKTEQS